MSHDPVNVEVDLDMQEVHTASVGLLTYLEEQDLDMGTACAALALSLGRLLSPKAPMEGEEEVKFIQAALEYTGLYFAGGGVN